MVLINIEDTYILTGYKSPSVDNKTFISYFEKFKINKYNQNNFIFIGDFNYDIYLENTSIEKYLNNQNLKRSIPSKISTTNFNTQIDIIFVNKIKTNFTAGVYETFFSDHKPIFIGINTIDTLSNANNNINNADDDIDDNTKKIMQ